MNKCEWCGTKHGSPDGQCPNTIMRTDNAESREFWRFVRKTSADVRANLPAWARLEAAKQESE